MITTDPATRTSTGYTGAVATAVATTPGPVTLLLSVDGVLATAPLGTTDVKWHRSARVAIQRMLTHEQHEVYVLTQLERAVVTAALNVPYHRVLNPQFGERSDRLSRWAAQTRDVLAWLPDLPDVQVKDQHYSVALHATPFKLARLRRSLSGAALPHGWRVTTNALSVLLSPADADELGAAAAIAALDHTRTPVVIGATERFEPLFEQVQGQGGLGIRLGRGPSCAAIRFDQPDEVIRLMMAWTSRRRARGHGDVSRDAV